MIFVMRGSLKTRDKYNRYVTGRETEITRLNTYSSLIRRNGTFCQQELDPLSDRLVVQWLKQEPQEYPL